MRRESATRSRTVRAVIDDALAGVRRSLLARSFRAVAALVLTILLGARLSETATSGTKDAVGFLLGVLAVVAVVFGLPIAGGVLFVAGRHGRHRVTASGPLRR